MNLFVYSCIVAARVLNTVGLPTSNNPHPASCVADAPEGVAAMPSMRTLVQHDENRIFVGGIPYYLNEDQVGMDQNHVNHECEPCVLTAVWGSGSKARCRLCLMMCSVAPYRWTCSTNSACYVRRRRSHHLWGLCRCYVLCLTGVLGMKIVYAWHVACRFHVFAQ